MLRLQGHGNFGLYYDGLLLCVTAKILGRIAAQKVTRFR